MDIIVGVLFAALVIGVSTVAGRSLERARRRAEEDGKDVENGEDAQADGDLYGDF